MPKSPAKTVGEIDRGGGQPVRHEPTTFRDAGRRPVMTCHEQPSTARWLQNDAGRVRRLPASRVSSSPHGNRPVSPSHRGSRRRGPPLRKRPCLRFHHPGERHAEKQSVAERRTCPRRPATRDRDGTPSSCPGTVVGSRPVNRTAEWPWRASMILRRPSHGGDIAQVGDGGSISDVFQRGQCQVEMDAFGQQIRRHERPFARPEVLMTAVSSPIPLTTRRGPVR